MANTFKSNPVANVGTTATTIYTCPTATQTTAIGMSVANTTASMITVSVTFVSGGVTVYLVKNANVPVGGALVVLGGDQKVVLEAGDYIQVVSSADSSADVLFSYLEIA